MQEFLGGEDLSALIARREPIELADKIQLLVGVTFGLDYAHNAGVVHRDVKPANVRVLENRLVKIMDFGIAKAMDTPTSSPGTGITVGSSGYMAPEQVSGDPIDGTGRHLLVRRPRVRAPELPEGLSSENLFRLLEMIVKEEPEGAAPGGARAADGAPGDRRAGDAQEAVGAVLDHEGGARRARGGQSRRGGGSASARSRGGRPEAAGAPRLWRPRHEPRSGVRRAGRPGREDLRDAVRPRGARDSPAVSGPRRAPGGCPASCRAARPSARMRSCPGRRWSFPNALEDERFRADPLSRASRRSASTRAPRCGTRRAW